jgi:hypothetical protein
MQSNAHMRSSFLLVLLKVSAAAGSLPPLAPLSRGLLVTAKGWCPPELVAALREDAISLEKSGAFRTAGLSNTAKGDISQQKFGAADRAICTITAGLGGDRAARKEFDSRLAGVIQACGEELGRRRLVVAEQYYSVSGEGSRLARHMDERHEELKGARGYSAKQRRSVSWLCYLNEVGWDESKGPGAGGALRAYVRNGGCGASCGAHEGNLQVGWMEKRGGGGAAEPIFLDAWVPVEAPPLPDADPTSGPRYLSYAALYRVTGDGTSRDYVSGLVEGGGAHTVEDLVATLERSERRQFSKVDVPASVTQPPPGSSEALVSPLGGTLLLFDSVAVPHEVLPTTRGRRFAMAGWLHEESQQTPEWIYSGQPSAEQLFGGVGG